MRTPELQPAGLLRVEGAYNVRDLGGYDTVDGRRTRWRTFIRADSLHMLPQSSQRQLVEYGIRTVVDLRRTRETIATPNVFGDSRQVRYLHINMLGDTDPPGYGTPKTDDVKSSAWRSRSYQITLDYRKEAIRDILRALSEPANTGLLFHCAGGTDRTGIIAALLLGLAGVEHNTIAADYSLSAEALRTRFLAEGIPEVYSAEVSEDDLARTQVQDILAPPDSMLLTLRYLDDKYGGIESYVYQTGLTEAQISGIRNSMLE